jgi:beta-glucanase (GH16 family)
MGDREDMDSEGQCHVDSLAGPLYLKEEQGGGIMKSVRSGLLGIFCIFAVSGSPAQDLTASAQGWSLVWSDEFDSSAINTTNWTYDTGGGGWGNSELENYTNRPENASAANGALMIMAKKESYGGNSYTSARLKSQNLRAFTYGRIEARIKLPAAQGLWPAFWMLGSSITQVGWPKCGEIDIMEHINSVPLVYGTMHWDNNGHVSYGGNISCDVTQYHTYTLEWNSSSITWFLDGSQYWQGNIANNINSTDEFHAPFFIILNLAIGGSWPGSPDGTTPFPDTMFVDYVRVYQLSTGIGGIQTDPEPVRPLLVQNYPNPFNPTTTIRYGITRRSFVRLFVYNALGEIAAESTKGMMDAGYHEWTMDGNGLPSGVYFCRLSAGDEVRTLRMVLIR